MEVGWESVVGQVRDDDGLEQGNGSGSGKWKDSRYFREKVDRHCLWFGVGI